MTAGYFVKPRLALPLYLEVKKALPPGSFSIVDLERGLARLLRSGGPLMRTRIDAQYHYHDWHEIFQVDPSDHDAQLFLPAVSGDLLNRRGQTKAKPRNGEDRGFTN